MAKRIENYQPQTVSNTSANGGRMTSNLIVPTPNGAGNFPAVNDADRLNGITNTRKIFAKVLDVTVAAQMDVTTQPTPSPQARNYIIAGTQRDQQGAIGTRKYAGGFVASAISESDTVITVTFETGAGALDVVQAGDTLRLWNNTATVTQTATVLSRVWTGDSCAITLTAPVGMAFDTSSFAGSCIVNTTDVNPRVDNLVKTGLVGTTFDDENYPILTNRIGTDEHTITITVLDANTFSVVSDWRGALPNGQFSSNYIYQNPAFSETVFFIRALAWGGTHTAGEVMTFQTHPAAVPVWGVHVVSAGAAVYESESINVVSFLA
jgi:hypothetical protein